MMGCMSSSSVHPASLDRTSTQQTVRHKGISVTDTRFILAADHQNHKMMLKESDHGLESQLYSNGNESHCSAKLTPGPYQDDSGATRTTPHVMREMNNKNSELTQKRSNLSTTETSKHSDSKTSEKPHTLLGNSDVMQHITVEQQTSTHQNHHQHETKISHISKTNPRIAEGETPCFRSAPAKNKPFNGMIKDRALLQQNIPPDRPNTKSEARSTVKSSGQ